MTVPSEEGLELGLGELGEREVAPPAGTTLCSLLAAEAGHLGVLISGMAKHAPLMEGQFCFARYLPTPSFQPLQTSPPKKIKKLEETPETPHATIVDVEATFLLLSRCSDPKPPLLRWTLNL